MKNISKLLLAFLVILLMPVYVKAADVTENFTVTDAKACDDANCTTEYTESNPIQAIARFLVKIDWTYSSDTAIEDGDTIEIPFANDNVSETSTYWNGATASWSNIYDNRGNKIGTWRIYASNGAVTRKINIKFSDYAVGKTNISGTLVTAKNIYSYYSYRDITVPLTVNDKIINVGMETMDLNEVGIGVTTDFNNQSSDRVKWRPKSPRATVKKLYLYDDYQNYDDLGNDSLFDSVIVESEVTYSELNSDLDLVMSALLPLPTNEAYHGASTESRYFDITSFFTKVSPNSGETYNSFKSRISSVPLTYGIYEDPDTGKLKFIVNFGDQPSSNLFYNEAFIKKYNNNFSTIGSYLLNVNPFTYYSNVVNIIERANGINNIVNGAVSLFALDYYEYYPEVTEDTDVSHTFTWTYTDKNGLTTVKDSSRTATLKAPSAYSVVNGTAELHLRDKSDAITKIDGVNIKLQKNNNGTWEDVKTGLVTNDNGVVSVPNLEDGEYRFVQLSYKNHYVNGSLKTYLNNNLTSEITSFTLNGDGKVIYGTNERESYTVTYKAGEHGDFEDQVYTVYYGDRAPSFNATSNDGWDFVGWSPEFQSTVLDNATYTATWEKKVNLTVHHYISGTTNKLSDDVTSVVLTGDTYTTNVANDVSNYYEFVGTSGEVSGTVGEEDIEVIYYYSLRPATLTVNYVDSETGEVLSSKVDSNLHYGETYTTSESDEIARNYTLKRIDGEPSGTVESSNIEITYYYEKKDSKLEVNFTKTGTSEITSKDSKLEYEIKYEVSIEDYIGDATVTITDTLPYAINETESNLDGGTYNSTDNTITWTDEIKDIDSYDNGSINITKNISIKYSNLDSEKRIMANNAKANITLDNNSKEVTTSSSTNIKIPGKITVKYIDPDTEKELKDTIISEGLVGDLYSLVKEELEGYDLVEGPETEVVKYQEEPKEYTYSYKKKVFNISTEVLGTGGTIQGDEPVKYGEDSTPKKIVIKANDNYYIGKVLVNNEEIKIKSGLKTLTLDNFKEVKENKNVAVIFNKELENPKTGNNTIYYIIFGLLIVSIGVAIFIIRKRMIKRRK